MSGKRSHKRSSSSKFYKSIAENIQKSIVIIDLTGVILFVNRFTEEMFGYSREELIGVNVSILAPPPHRQLHDKYLRDYSTNGDTSNPHPTKKVYAIRKDQSRVPIELKVYDCDDNTFIGMMSNLSDCAEIDKINEIQEKNMFVTNISHELRTPLNALINMNYLLYCDLNDIRPTIGEDKFYDIRDKMDTIKHSGTILLTQINDILDFSKLDAKKVVLRQKPFILRDCIESCKEIHTSGIREKNIDFLISIDPDVPNNLVGDFERLTQILINVISNAIKFTDSGKIKLYVSVGFNENGKNDENGKNNDIGKGTGGNKKNTKIMLKFQISDTGIGIDDNQRDNLFNLFTQLDTSHTKKYSGTGLGLAICKRICNLMNGDIWLEKSDTGLAHGSTFSFTTEFSLYEAETELVSISKNLDNIDMNIFIGKNVLIVDNDPENTLTFSTYAFEWGMKPVITNSGKSALVYVKNKYNFDIVFLDIKMPDMDGISLARRIKNEGCVYPIIALSSADDMTDQDRVLFDEVIRKPVNKIKLLRTTHRILFQQNERRNSMITVSGSSELSTSSDESITEFQVRTTPSSTQHNYKAKILVAEDNADNRKVISGLLLRLGYKRVTIVENGLLALEAFKKEHFDLILMDIKMPVMDGLESAKSINSFIKTHPRKYKTTMIALTAVAAYGEKDFYIHEGGFDDYLSKPIYVPELRDLLIKYLHQSDGSVVLDL